MNNLSSGERDGLLRLPSSISQNLRNSSSPDGQRAWNDVIHEFWYSVCTVPNNTQPNWVSKAEGKSGGPNRRPRSTTRLRMSSPRNRSILLGVSNPGSDNCIPYRCVQCRSLGTGLTGKFEVTWGNTIASSFRLTLPWFNSCIRNCTTEREAFFMMPPIPSTWIYRCLHCKWCCCARRSVEKNVEEPESSKGHAWIT